MSAVSTAVLVGLALVAGLLVGLALGRRARATDPGEVPAEPGGRPPAGGPGDPAPAGGAPAWLGEVLDVLRSAALVLDAGDDVVLANPAARGLGLVRGSRVAVPELARLVRACRAVSEVQVAEVDLPRRGRRQEVALRVRIAPLGGEGHSAGHVVLLAEDVSEARRVDAVRRDFVANVSHELKTPVGAMSLLAEALLEAADDPDAVRRFAARVQHESTRLTRLVQELIDLSRLQGADPLPAAEDVAVDAVVTEALDRNRLLAAARGVEIVSGGVTGLVVRGSEPQLVTALSNLVENAVTYSPAGTRIAVAARGREDVVEVSVTDQGIGIAADELDRVFERFYRSDPARSRATGGTGLGLAIVKHVASNHGGSVTVWSVEGQGSTFTLRLPARRRAAPPTRPSEPEESPVPSLPARPRARGGAA